MFAKDDKNQFLTQEDIDKLFKLARNATGEVKLTVAKNGTPEIFDSHHAVLYISEDSVLVEAFFAEDTGEKVPAVAIVFYGELKVGNFKILREPRKSTALGLWGMGRSVGGSGGVTSEYAGKGTLNVSRITSPGQTPQAIECTFEFSYTDKDGVHVEVVADKVSLTVN